MKGLILKDWYMMKKYCRMYLVVAIFFLAASLFTDGNMFFVFYPCLLCGMIPVNLIGYDERSRWMQYSGTLPCTRTQIVSAKYLIGLAVQAAMLIVTGIVQGIKMEIKGGFAADDLACLMLTLLAIATLASAIPLPFIFKLGVEKGRTAYYVMVGFVCGSSVLFSSIFRGQLETEIQMNALLTILAVAGVGVYMLSWYLSVIFYNKREI